MISSATRERTNLQTYFEEIRELDPLTQDQERDLWSKVRRGDKKAERRFITSNLKFVVAVARNYLYSGIPLEDLTQEGNIGLIRAVKKFDARKNFKFVSYAVWWIRQAILQAISRQSRITRIPVNQSHLLHTIGKAREKFLQINQREPSTEEIGEMLGEKGRHVVRMIGIMQPKSSLDTPTMNRGQTYGDLIPDKRYNDMDTYILSNLSKQCVFELLDGLNERQQHILKLYYGLNGEQCAYTLEEIGQQMKLTRERVRQIKERALKKLRENRILIEKVRSSIETDIQYEDEDEEYDY